MSRIGLVVWLVGWLVGRLVNLSSLYFCARGGRKTRCDAMQRERYERAAALGSGPWMQIEQVRRIVVVKSSSSLPSMLRSLSYVDS
ncbi:hypothetical protein IWZ03DRAFT_364864 [Phyllosticta citriasiana]|uniref:Secreted protein n=1 Tax=Phyllosticta citriasiana TaxID=595635 RepID=A0ABR1KXK0_9PEZI